MRVALLLGFLFALGIPLDAKTWVIAFTGYGLSPAGEGCGSRGEYPDGVWFEGHGMTEAVARLRQRIPPSDLEARVFTFFNEGKGVSCSSPLDGEADHLAALEFMKGRIGDGDRIIVAGHSYGGHRALLFALQLERSLKRPVDALVLADPIDWTICNIRDILNGGRISDCRQNSLTVPLEDSALDPARIWVFRQERGYRFHRVIWPVLFGYNVTADGVAVQTTILRTVHADVDNSEEVQSLLDTLVLSGASSVTKSASAPSVSK